MFKRLKGKEIDALEARLSALSKNGEERDDKAAIIQILIDLAQAQTGTMLAIAAGKIGDSDLQRSSMKDGAEALQRATHSLQIENDKVKSAIAAAQDEVKSISKAMGRG